MALRLHRFWLKAGLILILVGLSQWLLFDREPGLNLGVLSLALLFAAGLTNRAVWRTPLAVIALLAGLAFALLQIERATLVGWVLYAVAIGVCVLAPRAPDLADARDWAVRLGSAAVKGLVRPWRDFAMLLDARRRSTPLRLTAITLTAVAPVLGGAVFLWLFSIANPLIADGIGRLQLPELDFARLGFGLIVGFVAYTAMRPQGLQPRAAGGRRALGLPTLTKASVAMSLVTFNAIFALQNGLDIAFLWSGAPLPPQTTLAEYAHRGAYPLVITAVLAGLFVLLFLRPGTTTAASGPIRLLVVAWLAQNLFLLSSTVLRTVDYVDAYSLTRMRLAALVWMLLVANGLLLIGWRLVREKSGSWLINANALAAAMALGLCSVVDLGAVAAHWNVRHAREVGGRGVAIDLCYLRGLQGASLISLAELEQRPLAPATLDRVRAVRGEVRQQLEMRQSDWRAWRWRDARRLERNRQLAAGPAAPAPFGRACDGAPHLPPRPAPPLALTSSAKGGT